MADANEKMREALKRLADACDVVGVKYFDTDTMSEEVQVMQAATRDAREALAQRPAQGEAVAPAFFYRHEDANGNEVAPPTPYWEAPPAPSVPDGWKLVPMEPTSEMQDAMLVAFYKHEKHFIIPELWAAMLAAAPEPPK